MSAHYNLVDRSASHTTVIPLLRGTSAGRRYTLCQPVEPEAASSSAVAPAWVSPASLALDSVGLRPGVSSAEIEAALIQGAR